MNKIRVVLLSAVALFGIAASAVAGDEAKAAKVETPELATVGKPAPGFTLVDAAGKKQALADYKGKWVVLEWVNFDCPFVRKHYDSKNMQTLQGKYAGQEVVWLSICSSAPGKQGYFEGDALKKRIQDEGIKSTAYLIDATGEVGRLYEAKTTPQMFVINPEGVLLYGGAIDDRPSAKPEDVQGATNYVVDALTLGMSGKPVATSWTKSYGCSVKYGS